MPQKTKCMLVGSSHKLRKSRDLHLTIGDYKIECVKQYKLLGVNLDNNLKRSYHVDNIHKKLTNKVLLLRWVKPYITLKMRKLYYNSYILPILDYGIILRQFAPKHKLKKIVNIQKWTACMILDKLWDHPSNLLFKEFNWLTLQSHITYHVALLVFKIHTDLAPYYLKTILLFISNSRYELRSESRYHLAQTKKKSYYSNLTLQSISVPIWNNIPEHMKSAITVNTIKSMLKKHLFYTY